MGGRLMETKVQPRRGLRRPWWPVVAGIVAVLGAWVLASRGPDGYEASTRLLVDPQDGDADTLRAAGTLARTDALIAGSRWLLKDTARSLGLPADEIEDVEVDASADEETR